MAHLKKEVDKTPILRVIRFTRINGLSPNLPQVRISHFCAEIILYQATT